LLPLPALLLCLCSRAFFTQVTLHFGTQNRGAAERWALFSVYTPFADERQDDYQIYRSTHASLCQAAPGDDALSAMAFLRSPAVCAGRS